ncbi:MAG: hypothetical protein LQ340_004354 [Diploschistes diacapsis]|nr:MAG: hypothetical protein LQ340_004354 [Diploschistes diacapsis]
MAHVPNEKELSVSVDRSSLLGPATDSPQTPTRQSLTLLPTTARETYLSTLYPNSPTTPDYDPSSNTHNPFSAFYSHPQTRTSLEQLRQSTSHLSHYSGQQQPESTQTSPLPAYAKRADPSSSAVDLELGEKLHLSPPPCYPRPSLDPSTCAPSSVTVGALSGEARKPCTAWPGKEHFRLKRKEMKRRRGCWPLRNLGKKQRRWAQALIVLLVVGVVVAVGVGVSIKTGAGVYRSNGVSEPIS